MYQPFVDGNSMRGVPEPSRSPARHPFMNYYGSKLPDSMHYHGMAPAPRQPNPYSGKPDAIYGGHPNWNPMMMPQSYSMAKPPMNKPDYQYPGQEHIFNRGYPNDPLSYGPGYVPGHHYPPHYPTPPHPHYPSGDSGFHDSFNAGPQQNDLWTRQQPSVVINDGTGSDSGSPAPRSAVGWGPGGEMVPPDPSKQQPSVSPRNSPSLHKESSVSSLKEALMSGSQQLYNESKAGSSSGPGLGPSPGPGSGTGPGPMGGVNFPMNSSYLGVSEMRDRASPMTPNMVPTPGPPAQTPHMTTPTGIVGVGGPDGGSPLVPPPSHPVPVVNAEDGNLKNSFDGNTQPINRQPSPFEMDKILGGLKDNEIQNGTCKTDSPVSESVKPISPASVGGGSPRSRKVRMSPTVMSPVDRNHSSLSSQYSLSNEPGRKEFLDALLDHLEKEGTALLRVPTVCKTQLDLYKSFTAVQQLGGFRHVVEKRLWKDVLRSFNPSAATASSAGLRLLQEYYVKMLLPYECHLSNTSLKECLAHYEMKGSPTVNNSHEVGEVLTNSSSSSTLPDKDQAHPQKQDANSNADSLIPFSEDSQNSLDGISSQPLPDISVQEAEFVLGIPPNSNQHTPTPHSSYSSFPPNANWSDFISGPPPPPSLPPEDRNFPSPHHSQMPLHPPGMGGDPSFMFPPYNDQFTDYRSRLQMSHYMNRQPYMGSMPPPTHMGDAAAPGGYMPSHHYPQMMNRPHHRVDEPSYNNMDWQWNQQRPRLPPPLPPHLQSMSFQVPHSQSSHPSPAPQNSSRPSTPQSGPPDIASPHRPSSQSNLDPIKIHWQDQQQGSSTSSGRNTAVAGVPTPPPTSQPQAHPPVSREPLPVPEKDEKLVKQTPPLPKVPEPAKLLRPPPVTFTPVEMTEPIYRKRRKLNSDSCGQVEPWRVMMSLKSGLAPDSTWALDTLSILLHDDRTVGFFYLRHHHSLLNTLIDHFTKSLNDVFGPIFDILPKYVKQPPKKRDDFGKPDPIESPVYRMSKTDVDLGRIDHLSHIHTCFKVDSTDQDVTSEMELVPTDVRERKDLLPPLSKVCRVDETPLNDLLKRDALGERILFHLKTPRRVMVCSPIQKFFPPTEEPTVPLVYEENEVVKREPTPLVLLSEQRESLVHRCLTISNIIRSLSFIPGNDLELSQHAGLLIILGKLLLLCHHHLPKPPSPSSLLHPSSEADSNGKEFPKATCAREECSKYWWWDCLEVLRENVFIMLANIAGQLDLSVYPEAISYPLLDGLLHWLVCPSSTATDPLPDTAMATSLSPQRLVLEALAKISISEVNVDYILATPPLTRLDLVYDTLLQFISQRKHPASKQFALVCLSNLAQGGEGASRMIGQQKMALPLLLECLESAEQLQLSSKGRMMFQPNPDDPASLSIAMLRRTVITLHCLARVPLNRVSFLPYCSRLLSLVMSNALDSSLTSILSDVLFELNRIA